jgi:pilus assembly protein CpaB
MRTKGLALVTAVVLAIGATAAVYLYVRGIQRTARNPSNLTIIVAKQDIPSGTQLDSLISGGAFTTLSIPQNAVVQGAVTDLAQLKGRTTSSFILQGEQISTARLQGSTQPTGGALGIPAGDQAVTISLETQRVVGGFIQGGDHVVVYATFDGGKNGQESVTLVPDVQVLRVSNQGAATGSNGPQPNELVTLALSSRDAAKVVLAQAQGSIWLSLLPPNGQGVAQPPVTVSEVSK